jgi:hypothetical protein
LTTKRPSQDRDRALHEFLDYIDATNRKVLRGVSVIAVSMHELQATLEKAGTHTELNRDIKDAADQLPARLFDLNGRMYILVPHQDETHFMQAVFELRMMVSKAAGSVAATYGLEPSEFVRALNSKRDAERLDSLARDAVRDPGTVANAVGPPGRLAQRHLDGVVARAEQMGPVAFFQQFGRAQSIARLRRGEAPMARGHEVFISMAELQRQLLPGVQLSANRNLFKELTLRLDRIVLAALSDPTVGDGPVSVNMNVRNLITPEFERLARHLQARPGAELWVEIDVPDVLANLRDYFQARKTLRRYDVFLLADNLDFDLLPAVEGASLDLDGYKFAFPEDDPVLDRLADAVERAHAARKPVVLTRCEHDAAVTAGQSLGISHFQGFFIDELLKGEQKLPEM